MAQLGNLFLSSCHTSGNLISGSVLWFLCSVHLSFFFFTYFLNVITRNMGTNIFNTLYSGCLCSLQAPEYYFPSLQILRGTQVLSYSAHKVQKFALPLSCLRKGGVLLLWLCF